MAFVVVTDRVGRQLQGDIYPAEQKRRKQLRRKTGRSFSKSVGSNRGGWVSVLESCLCGGALGDRVGLRCMQGGQPGCCRKLQEPERGQLQS